MQTNTYVRINLKNLVDNFKKVKKCSPGKKTICIVKADAYGCGARVCSQVLQNAGADAFAVANLDEAAELRASGILKPIFVLGYIPIERISEVISASVIPSIYSQGFAELLSKAAEKKKREVSVSVKLNTGMNRLGFFGEEKSVNAVKKINALPYLNVNSVFSHYATADETDLSFSETQYERFNKIITDIKNEGVNPEYIHIDNSAGILRMQTDLTTAVRPGIILYGVDPTPDSSGKKESFAPVMTFLTRVADTFTLEAGESVSYARTFTAKAKTKVAVLCAGYADGYFRQLSNKAEVNIKGQRAKIIGNICMDMLMVDVTNLKNIKVGDEAVLFGEDPTASELADIIGTIPYEVMCSLSKRVTREYEGV